MLFEFNKTRFGKKWASHHDMDGIKFCLRALSKKKDERRNHVIRLYVKGGVMTGTDGSRLHKYEPETEMPDGFYRPLVNSKTETILYHEKDNDAEYPDYDSLLKPPKDCAAKTLYFGPDSIFAGYATALRAFTEYTLRFDHLKDLGDDFFDLFITRDADGDEAGALFVNGKKTALIMGMRM